MTAKFELFKDKAGEFRWRLRHQNGNVIADSGEGYTTKTAAINGIESVKKNISLVNIKDTDIHQSVSQPEKSEAPKIQSTLVEGTPAKSDNDRVSESMKASAPSNQPTAVDQTTEVVRAPISEPAVHPLPENQQSRIAGRPTPAASVRVSEPVVPLTSENKPKAVGQPVSLNKKLPDNDLVIIVAIIVAAAFLVLAAGIILLNR